MLSRKYSNPHSATITSEPASRSQIYGTNDDSTMITDGRDVLEDIHWLETHIQSSLVPGEQVQTHTKRRKMRKTGAKDRDDSAAVFEFRLLSNSRSPHRICIQPKPPKAIRLNEREHEDSAEHAELRKQRALEVAVDLSWLAAQSKISFPVPPNDAKKCRILRPLASLAATPNMMVTERIKPPCSTTTNFPGVKPLHDPKAAETPTVDSEA
ncbi:hypothetical protein EW145_g1419 [Phellinidium pouzarii]|uniref:Uncharacterized protein n=1 Tax=Phellinidium pouzarii TaxID=167371 RepID=A0A4S4LF67_9AGAM|nr:hypothetical protein EW145_g1419 [Phellinidium pouzarii]